MRSQKTDDFLKEALNKMFQMVGFEKFDESFVKQKDWYTLKSWKPTEQEEFKEWFLKESQQRLKWSKESAKREYSYFNLMWGWKTTEPTETNTRPN